MLALLLLLATGSAAADARAGEWIAGDLHVHTTYSHDSYGGPGDDNTGIEDAHTFGFPVLGSFALAAERGMDYLAITDHNDVRSSSDAGFGAFGVIGVPGYEKSLEGHAQMLGATSVLPMGDPRSAAAVQELADAHRAAGGVFQVNHPVNSETEDPDDLDWALGYAVQPDTVEAWNGPRFYQPPFPASNSHDDAVRYWEGWLDRGAKVALTGGSDSHWVATAHGQGPGQPTTYIHVEERSVKGILDGLRGGHTMVSHQPPNLGGPRIFLEADGDRNGSYEAMVGDTVPAAAKLRVRVEAGAGAIVRVITDGGRPDLKGVLVTGPSFTKKFRLPAGRTWARAELILPDAGAVRRDHCPTSSLRSYCRNRLLVLAASSALYLTP